MSDNTMRRGPDFLCIGQQKAATGWLYDQFQAHPGAWVPPIKEIKYFNGNPFRSKSVKWARNYLYSRESFFRHPVWHTVSLFKKREIETTKSGRKLKSLHPHRDERFWLAFAEGAKTGSKDGEWYLDAFSGDDGLVTGDISPNYSTASTDEVGKAKATLPEAKILFIVREPVSRAMSAIAHAARKKKFPEEKVNDWDYVKRYLDTPEISGRSMATRTWETWRKSFPESQMRFWLMDDIKADPAAVRDQVFSLMGLDASGCQLPATSNRKAVHRKIAFTDEMNERLAEYFADETRACRDLFGGAARHW